MPIIRTRPLQVIETLQPQVQSQRPLATAANITLGLPFAQGRMEMSPVEIAQRRLGEWKVKLADSCAEDSWEKVVISLVLLVVFSLGIIWTSWLWEWAMARWAEKKRVAKHRNWIKKNRKTRREVIVKGILRAGGERKGGKKVVFAEDVKGGDEDVSDVVVVVVRNKVVPPWMKWDKRPGAGTIEEEEMLLEDERLLREESGSG